MKISNVLHFTENHDFRIVRDFSLSPLDYKCLTTIYQPMIGPGPLSLYLTMTQLVPTDRIGYSPAEQMRRLFLSLHLDSGVEGRKQIIQYTSNLEAIGLLKSSRHYMTEREEYVYEFRLFPPLSPLEFFKNQHLVLLLRDRIGKHAVIGLREQFISDDPPQRAEEIHAEDISMPFYDLFQLNAKIIDYELEQALLESAPSLPPDDRPPQDVQGFTYADIIHRFPRGSSNRHHVEFLKYIPEQLAAINFVAKKYRLTLQETCRLLDEDGVFTPDSEVDLDVIQQKANGLYRQDKRRSDARQRSFQRIQQDDASAPPAESGIEAESAEHPAEGLLLDVPDLFAGQCDKQQYNFIMKNEPYTRVLERFFSQGSVPDGILDIFEKIDLNYRLPEPVINVLIHFIYLDKRSWVRSSIEAVASDMLGRQVGSFEKAVDYIREKQRVKAEMNGQTPVKSGGARNRGRKNKREIPIVTENVPREKQMSQEELERIRMMAKKLDGKL